MVRFADLPHLRALNLGGCFRLTDLIITGIGGLALAQVNLSVTKVRLVGSLETSEPVSGS